MIRWIRFFTFEGRDVSLLTILIIFSLSLDTINWEQIKYLIFSTYYHITHSWVVTFKLILYLLLYSSVILTYFVTLNEKRGRTGLTTVAQSTHTHIKKLLKMEIFRLWEIDTWHLIIWSHVYSHHNRVCVWERERERKLRVLL